MPSFSAVTVPRSGNVESVHRISVAVVNERGELIRSTGDPHIRTYFRSSAKPLQVIPLLEAGGAEAFGFTSAELSVMSASHDGEIIHVETVRSILSKIGLEEMHLFCGPHEPYHVPTNIALRKAGKDPCNLHNNCSGKHAGMLSMAVLKGWPVEGYQLPDHPVQQEVFKVISEAACLPVPSIIYGTDGCGIPTFHMTLFEMAKAYGKLSAWWKEESSKGHAVKKLMRAIAEEPVLLEGTTGFSSAIVAATQGKVFGKVGGEGMYCMAVPGAGIGIVLKVEDGNRRASSPAAVEILRIMQLITDRELEALSDYHRPVIRNHQGTQIGRLTPELHLEP
jgi:L-asparaginase II